MLAALDSILKALLSLGPLGVVVAAMSVAIWQLQKDLSRVQEQRVKDAFKIVDVSAKCASALEHNTELLRSFLGEGDAS